MFLTKLLIGYCTVWEMSVILFTKRVYGKVINLRKGDEGWRTIQEEEGDIERIKKKEEEKVGAPLPPKVVDRRPRKDGKVRSKLIVLGFFQDPLMLPLLCQITYISRN